MQSVLSFMAMLPWSVAMMCIDFAWSSKFCRVLQENSMLFGKTITSILFAFTAFNFISCQRVRRCLDRSLKISARGNYDVKISHEEILEGTPDNFNLLVNIHWNVTGLNASEYDGFLVRMRVATGDIPLAPHDDCEASSTHLWLQTENVSDCGTVNQTMFNCYNPPRRNNTISCPCDKKTCPFLEGVTCYGSKGMMDEMLGGYHALPNNRRSIKYRTKFNTHYVFELYLYYRQYVTYSVTRRLIAGNFRCAEKLSATYGMSVVDANVKCCESNVTALSPMDILYESVVLDKKSRTLNATISWKPPAKIDTLQGVFPNLLIDAKGPISIFQYRPALTTLMEEGEINGTERCPKDIRRTVVVAYNLLPNVDYIFYVVSWHTDENRDLCSRGRCGNQLKFKLEINPCDEKWKTCNPGYECVPYVVDGNYTVPKTTCEPMKDYVTSTSQVGTSGVAKTTTDITGTTKDVKASPTSSIVQTSKITGGLAISDEICDIGYCHHHADCYSDPENNILVGCTCRDGMIGNAISKAYNGTGCNECFVSDDCDTNAICVKDDPPSTDFICRCRDGYYGDGLKDGSRCSSESTSILSIVVPVVFVGIVLFAIVIRQ